MERNELRKSDVVAPPFDKTPHGPVCLQADAVANTRHGLPRKSQHHIIRQARRGWKQKGGISAARIRARLCWRTSATVFSLPCRQTIAVMTLPVPQLVARCKRLVYYVRGTFLATRGGRPCVDEGDECKCSHDHHDLIIRFVTADKEKSNKEKSDSYPGILVSSRIGNIPYFLQGGL